MNSWKIVKKIATAFSVVFIVFGALSALLAYEQLNIQYGSSAPASYILLTSLNVMLPSMLYAVLSFVVAVFSSRLAKETDKKEANMTAKTETD
jgi:magnesium-transporting ATPase (P-type)